ncbi:hypothetical protein GGX14DRAFT_435284, partial [Mycena pura]
SAMCRWRQVQHHYTDCPHFVELPDEEIKCDSTECKFSPCHPDDCTGSSCRRTCWQYRQFPEQHNRTFRGKCSRCTEG